MICVLEPTTELITVCIYYAIMTGLIANKSSAERLCQVPGKARRCYVTPLSCLWFSLVYDLYHYFPLTWSVE
jgi:hypothetical protein